MFENMYFNQTFYLSEFNYCEQRIESSDYSKSDPINRCDVAMLPAHCTVSDSTKIQIQIRDKFFFFNNSDDLWMEELIYLHYR